MAGLQVSRKMLFSMVMLSRGSVPCARISITGAAYPGRQSVSLNTSPFTVTLSAPTTIREFPVNTTSPGIPDLSVCGCSTARTVSWYVPGGIVIGTAGAKRSILLCMSDFGSASITYAYNDPSGKT